MKNSILMALLCALVGGASVQAGNTTKMREDFLKNALNTVKTKKLRRGCEALTTLLWRTTRDGNTDGKTVSDTSVIEGLFREFDNTIECKKAGSLCELWLDTGRNEELHTDLVKIWDSFNESPMNTSCNKETPEEKKMREAFLETALNTVKDNISRLTGSTKDEGRVIRKNLQDRCDAVNTLRSGKTRNGKTVSDTRVIEGLFREFDNTIECKKAGSLCELWAARGKNDFIKNTLHVIRINFERTDPKAACVERD